MKKIATLLLIAATMFAATAKAQDDPGSVRMRTQYKYAVIPVYTSGGFKVLVKNNTTGELEITSYTVVQDTVNGTRTFLANGTSNGAWQVTTPTTYKQLVTASRSGISGNVHLKDTSGSKYLDFNSNTGISALDTLWNIAPFWRVQTATGTKSVTADSTQLRVDCNKIKLGTGNVQITSGSGTPLYSINAPVGSLYIRTNGVTDSTLYVKMVGATDSAGWYPLKH